MKTLGKITQNPSHGDLGKYILCFVANLPETFSFFNIYSFIETFWILLYVFRWRNLYFLSKNCAKGPYVIEICSIIVSFSFMGNFKTDILKSIWPSVITKGNPAHLFLLPKNSIWSEFGLLKGRVAIYIFTIGPKGHKFCWALRDGIKTAI